jgi:adenylylsulfate kinase
MVFFFNLAPRKTFLNMLLIQLTGLSGSGKTTIAMGTKLLLEKASFKVEIIDGDEYRKHLCKDLGFSKMDRNENIRRLGKIGNDFTKKGIIAIISAINPYEDIRHELCELGPHVKTIWINCDIQTLIKRDPKGIYERANFHSGHPDKISNLSGLDDPYEEPSNADLVINTNSENSFKSINSLFQFILNIISLDSNILI